MKAQPAAKVCPRCTILAPLPWDFHCISGEACPGVFVEASTLGKEFAAKLRHNAAMWARARPPKNEHRDHLGSFSS